MKLYFKDEHVEVSNPNADVKVISEEQLNIDLALLDKCVDAYGSMNVVQEQLSLENFDLINKSNYVLYNEYIKNITSNLNLNPKIICKEDFSSLPTVAVNHQITLEGLIGSLWEKIKNIFKSINNSIKQFFTTYFTRVGRIKNKLKNLVEVLSKTDTDIKKLHKEDVPSGIQNKYPVNGTITYNTITEFFGNTSIISSILVNVNSKAKSLANKEILDRDFVSKIKNLKDLAKDSKQQIDKNNSEKEGLGLFGAKNKQIKEDNKSLKETIKDAENKADKLESDAVNIGSDASNIAVEFDDKEFETAKKEFGDLLKEIEAEFKKLVNKKLVNGKIITKVEVKEDTGIDIESEEDKETPNGLNLQGKSELLKLLKETIKTIEEVEKLSNNYAEVNDTIMKNLDTVDKLIKDIDSINLETLGKYKTVLTNKVKERLNLMKTFFNNYNKVNKNLFQLILDTAEGNAEYAVVCLKNFG